MTFSQIGRKVKDKHPGLYEDINDDDLGRHYAKKYLSPEEQACIEDASVVVYKAPHVPVPTAHPVVHAPAPPNFRNTSDHTRELLDNYHPRKGGFFPGIQRRRAEYAENLSKQQQHIATAQQWANAAEREAYSRQHNLQKAENQSFLEYQQTILTNDVIQDQRFQIQVNQELSNQALGMGMTAADYSRANYERFVADTKYAAELKHKRDMDAAERESKQKSAEIDIDTRLNAKEKIHELGKRLGQDNPKEKP